MKTNLNFITKSIPRDCDPLIKPLMLAYSKELGVTVSQSDAIGLAIRREYEKAKGK